MQTTSWGRYPICDAQVDVPTSSKAVASVVAAPGSVLPRGLGRSYGDSALAPHLIDVRSLDRLLAFDADSGEILKAIRVEHPILRNDFATGAAVDVLAELGRDAIEAGHHVGA